MESQPRWSPVDRSKSGGARPEMGVARKPVSQRSPEEQAAFRAQMEVRQNTSEPKVERVDRNAEVQAVDEWESRRQELAARGDIFDAKGNVTPGGQKVLIESGWNMQQIVQIENMQRNVTGEVETVSATEDRDEGPTMSARERPQVLADARARAEQELRERARRDEETRTTEIGRKRAGARAYVDAIRNNMSDADAERAQREAEQAYDAQIQQEKNLRRAS